MTSPSRAIALTALFAAFYALRGPALAQSASATAPAPAPSASPAAPAGPCGSISSLANRPTVTASPCTVPIRHLMAENGWTNTITGGARGGNAVTYPQTSVRFGTGSATLEVDAGLPSFNRASTGGALASGWGDGNVGAKYTIGSNAKTAWGASAQVTLPTGSRAFTAGLPQYSGAFDYLYTPTPVFTLEATLSANELSALDATGNGHPYFAVVPSVVGAISLPLNTSFFAEYAYFSNFGPGKGARGLIDGGLTIDPSAHVQLDIEYGIYPGTNFIPIQHYIGAGISLMN